MVKRIFVAGHNGMVGRAIVKKLKNDPNNEIVVATRTELDLVNQQAVNDFFTNQDIDQVYLAAAKVGGIHANNEFPADFIYENLMIESNIIHAAHKNEVQDLLFLGSSCIYPKHSTQPIKEDSLLTGILEETNEPYAISKIAGIKLCESYNRQYGRNYRSVMPTNLYGEHDNFHLENSHVIPALLRRFHEAKINKTPIVKAWGTGKPMREFLYVKEMASASIFIMNLDETSYTSETNSMLSHINIGTGVDYTIRSLTELVAKVVGYQGEIFWDCTKPDGTPRKLMDVSRLNRLGWKAEVGLEEGLIKTYNWFKKNQDGFRK